TACLLVTQLCAIGHRPLRSFPTRRSSDLALRALLSRLRVYAISDQDDSGAWIRREFPDLFYIVSPGGYDAATWRGIMQPEPGFRSEEHTPELQSRENVVCRLRLE